MEHTYIWNVLHTLQSRYSDTHPELPSILVQLLQDRNIADSEMDNFLNPDYADLLDPFLILDMKKSVERIIANIREKKSILIFTDYDADGVTGGMIMYQALNKIYQAFHTNTQQQLMNELNPVSQGAVDQDVITIYTPDRMKEGYGLTDDAVSIILGKTPDLVITIDCGVTAKDQIKALQDQGIDIIVIDHHSVPEEMPPAFGIIVPKRSGDPYPFKDLCGAGLSFKVATALLQHSRFVGAYEKIPVGYEKWLLDFAAIGTIADMVPLYGENRIIVKYGLYVLAKTRNLGLKALLEEAKIVPNVQEMNGTESPHISVYSVGFQIAPRINAAGRIAHANQAIALFQTTEEKQASSLAQELDTLNQVRKEQTEQVFVEVQERIAKNPLALQQQKLIFEGDSTWPIGVLGIVASRLVEKYHRPVVLYSIGQKKNSASARSIKAFNLAQAIHTMHDSLLSGGGHSQAAGFSFEENMTNTVRQLLSQQVDLNVSLDDMKPELTIDIELDPSEISWELYDIITRLAPFGMQNTIPLFMTRSMRIKELTLLGQEKNHVKVFLTSEQQMGSPVEFSAIGFGLAHRVTDIHINDVVDIVFQLEVNEWNGRRDLQLNLKDIRVSP